MDPFMQAVAAGRQAKRQRTNSYWASASASGGARSSSSNGAPRCRFKHTKSHSYPGAGDALYVVGWAKANCPVPGVPRGVLHRGSWSDIRSLTYKRKGLKYKRFDDVASAAEWALPHMLPLEADAAVCAEGKPEWTKPMSASTRAQLKVAAEDGGGTERPQDAAHPSATMGKKQETDKGGEKGGDGGDEKPLALVLCVDGSALQFNGSPNAPGGAGIAIGLQFPSRMEVVYEAAVPLPHPRMLFDGVEWRGPLPPHTSPRAEWYAMVRGLERLLQVMAEHEKAAHIQRVEVWSDHQNIVRFLHMVGTSSPTVSVTDANAWGKRQAAFLWRDVLPKHGLTTCVQWVAAHQPKSASHGWRYNKTAFVAHLNARADVMADQAARAYRMMYRK